MESDHNQSQTAIESLLTQLSPADRDGLAKLLAALVQAKNETPSPPRPIRLVKDAVRDFLAYKKTRVGEHHYAGLTNALGQFVEKFGDRDVASLKGEEGREGEEIETWAAGFPWPETTASTWETSMRFWCGRCPFPI